MQKPLNTDYRETGLTQEAKDFIEEVFTYHNPDAEQEKAFKAVRDALVNAAQVILANVPSCADRSSCFRKLREARMDANAAISLKGLV